MKPTCSKCGSNDIRWKGWRNGVHRFSCNKCNPRNRGVAEKAREYQFSSDGFSAELSANTSERITTVEQLIEFLNIDTEVWRVQKFQVSKNEGYRKDRSVHWEVSDGKVTRGEVHDTGKLLIEPLFNVKVWLVRKTEEIRLQESKKQFELDAREYVFEYPKIKYPILEKGTLFEIAIPDIHLGRLTWDEESGESSDLKKQTERVKKAVDELLEYTRFFPVDSILLPLGNDFFNVDNMFNTTTRGTPQQEDTRWQKTFRTGRQLAVEIIDKCSMVAPVEVLIIPGNHDETRTFYLGDALESWYHSSKNVNINNGAKKRK